MPLDFLTPPQKGQLLPEEAADDQAEELQVAGEEDGSDTDVALDSKYPPKRCNRCQAQLDPVGTLCS